ncbi:acetyltransferase [Lyngbya confervoides]
MRKESATLVKVMDLEALFNPLRDQVQGQHQAGEEEQPPRWFPKQGLAFPSGEALPQCWTDANYRQP